ASCWPTCSRRRAWHASPTRRSCRRPAARATFGCSYGMLTDHRRWLLSGLQLRSPYMRIDKLTIKAREALVSAQELASRRGNAEILPEHILYALGEQQDGLVPPLLRKLGVEPARVLEPLKQ